MLATIGCGLAGLAVRGLFALVLTVSAAVLVVAVPLLLVLDGAGYGAWWLTMCIARRVWGRSTTGTVLGLLGLLGTSWSSGSAVALPLSLFAAAEIPRIG